MRLIRFAVLYTALALGANAALSETPGPAPLEPAQIDALKQGDMKKLVFHSAPKPAGQTEFQTFQGEPITLSAYHGQVVLLNFWATWCAPCRHEMPMLSALQTEMGGDDFAVVTVATGRNPPPAMQKFFNQIGVENLPLHRDPKSKLAREMAVLGLPITVILDREGNEIARLRGDADWNSDSAKAILQALLAQ